jgi:hypothetical protein
MMEAKFHQLRPGQRFQWQDETYEKINPLLARHLGSGAQRLIPRSTAVVPLDGAATPPAAEPRPAGLQAVRHAFEDYHRSSLRWLEQQDGSEETLNQAREALLRARQRVLSALGEEGETASAFPDGNAD